MPHFAIGRRGALSLGAGAALGRPAAAAPTLDRAARIIVGVPPGSGTDLCARMLAEQLRDRYAPQVVVENRPGASTRVGIEAVKAAAPDGTTLLVAPVPVMTLFPHVFPKTTRYDALVDFAPVTTLASVAYGWVVRSDHQARTLQDFLAWAKAKGGGTFAPPVLGAPQHMMGLEVSRRAGVSLTPVSYRGGAAAQQDLIAGQIDSFIGHMGDLAGLLKGGQTRLIAVSTSARTTAWSDVPTFDESGFPGLPRDEAMGVYVPAQVPKPVLAALHDATVAAVNAPAMRDGLQRLEMTPLAMPQAALAERIRAEREAWGPIVRATGFSADD
jgi:tripartite-type tricarboxylate transporter receptor subunit TctC